MATTKVREQSRTVNWKVTGLVALAVALVFFWPYLGIICFAVIATLLFHPLYKLLDKFLPQAIAGALTVIIAVLIVFIPIALVTVAAVAQGVELANGVAKALDVASPDTIHTEAVLIVDQLNTVIDPLTSGQGHLTVDSIKEFFSQTLPVVLKSLTAVIVSFASSIPAIISAITIFLFLFIAFITNSKTLPERLRLVSPFNKELTELYFHRTRMMVHASVVSQLIIAFILGLLTTLLLGIIHGYNYFFFWVFFLTLLSMIPLGSGIVVYPMAVFAMAQGNIIGGLWVILIYTFVICNIDNIMRPRMIPKRLQLPPALMTLSIFSGLYYFGIIGVVYGPVIVILLITTYEAFLDRQRKVLGIADPAS